MGGREKGGREGGKEEEGESYTNDEHTYPGDPHWGDIDIQQLCVHDEGYTSGCG